MWDFKYTGTKYVGWLGSNFSTRLEAPSHQGSLVKLNNRPRLFSPKTYCLISLAFGRKCFPPHTVCTNIVYRDQPTRKCHFPALRYVSGGVRRKAKLLLALRSQFNMLRARTCRFDGARILEPLATAGEMTTSWSRKAWQGYSEGQSPALQL